jgi:hypothetical protein
MGSARRLRLRGGCGIVFERWGEVDPKIGSNLLDKSELWVIQSPSAGSRACGPALGVNLVSLLVLANPVEQ